MQTAVMDKLQQQMMSNIDKVSPEALMQSWLTFDPKIAERFQDMFATMAGLGSISAQEEMMAFHRSEPQAEGRLRPPGLAADAGRGEGDIGVQHQPVAFAALDARAAGATAIRCWHCLGFSPATCRWRRCGNTWTNSDTMPMHGKMGRNTGGIARLRGALRDRLAEHPRRHRPQGQRSSAGVSAASMPVIWRCRRRIMVRYVVTLGSPFANDVRATNATRLYEALSGETVDDNSELRQAIAGDLPVPTTSIYSRTDGIVNWRTCLLRPSDTAENIEVYLASHIGLGVNAAALWAVADRLAQAEGEFSPFDRSGPFAIAYGPPEHAQS